MTVDACYAGLCPVCETERNAYATIVDKPIVFVMCENCGRTVVNGGMHYCVNNEPIFCSQVVKDSVERVKSERKRK